VLGKRAEWTAQDIFPQSLITGDDLVTMGFKPGPVFKEILNRVEEEQLEGRIVGRQKALEFVKQHYM